MNEPSIRESLGEPLAGQKGDQSLQQMPRMDIIEEMIESVLVSVKVQQGVEAANQM